MKKTPLLYRIVKQIVYLVTPKMKIEGEDSLPKENCIIVANHSHMYGPIFSQTYKPRPSYTWCIGEMLHKEELPAYAFSDFWINKPKSIRWIFKIFSYVIAPLGSYLLKSADTIEVRKDRRIVKTFKDTIEKLEEGNDVVVFPECYNEHNNIVNEFQSGFANLGKMYYKQKKESLAFVPLYICPKLKKLVYGKPIYYNPQNDSVEEADRISNYLMDEISNMAYSLPEHTVIPYPNVSKKNYPRSRKI